ncbi:hypothetical protein [Streptomyces uncialis]|uniref:hypothetical protein n=1 Tax=Streptomyces uncialis TaxID=1048205 RepID=UPI000AA23A3F|nr:hypothetical protein [Streptomyces uncialis]
MQDEGQGAAERRIGMVIGSVKSATDDAMSLCSMELLIAPGCYRRRETPPPSP